MPETYDFIASHTISAATSTVTFSSISGNYTDLRLSIQTARGSATMDVWLRFNSSTSGYSRTRLSTAGTATPVAFISGGEDRAYFDAATGATNPGMAVIDIMNYSNSAANKSYLAIGGNTQTAIFHTSGLWNNTAAITSIEVGAANNYDTGTTMKLYGIKAV